MAETTLAYTQLRHRMLVKISEGDVSRGLGVAGWSYRSRIPSGYGHCDRSVDSIVHAEAARVPFPAAYDTPLEMTEIGRALLSSWNEKHGEPR
jgi:hypothetical protein